MPRRRTSRCLAALRPMLVVLLLVVLLLAGLPLTGVLQADEQPARLRAGAALSDITLPIGATNGGVIARGGPARAIHDALHVRALVLDDGRTKLAFAVCDLRMIGRPVVERAKQLASDATGIPGDRIIVSATHTHAAPGVIGMHTSEEDRAYADMVAAGVADAVRRADKNLAPAKIGWGFGAAPEHVFNRRWFLKPGRIPANPFGETTDRVKMNPPAGSTDLVEPAGPVDPQVSVLAVQHADGRPLALLANYGLHYVGGYQSGYVSADYFGQFADRVREQLTADTPRPHASSSKGGHAAEFVGIMTNGTSGDVNNIDFRSGRSRTPAWEKMRLVADDLADEAVRVYRGIEFRDRVRLASAAVELNLGVRRPDKQRLAWARKTLADVDGKRSPTRPEVYAQEALHLAEFPATVPVKLQAFGIGPLRIASIPCEVFAETGLAIKSQFKDRPVFTIELANGYNGYLPTPRQHRLGGYETWPARSAYLAVDAEPAIRAATLKLLAQLGEG